MPDAEIIAIGTEILLGEIVDTNSRYIARRLRELGLNIYRTATVGDNRERIAQAIREGLARSDIIITTGGLGPTVDDPTREAIALAFNVEIEFRPDLWEQVIERFRGFNRYPTENNRRQAHIPSGAIAIENPVGTAPAFRIEADERVVIALPGVPREMEHLVEQAVLPYLRQRYDLRTQLKVRVLHTSGVGESQVDERIGDLELNENPTVGLSAHTGQVDVRITAKAETEADAEAMIQGIETEVRRRLGNWIYGADGETLAQVAMRNLVSHGWRLIVVEAGLDGKLIRRFAGSGPAFLRGQMLPQAPQDPAHLAQETAAFRQMHQADIGLGVALYMDQTKQQIHLILHTPSDQQSIELPFGGPPKLAQRRAVNAALDLLRKL